MPCRCNRVDRGLGADMATAKQRLVEIIAEKSLSVGGATKLVSGRISTFYFDMKPTLFDPEGASLMADLVLDRLGAARPDFVGGLEMGAVPVVAAVCVRSHTGEGADVGGFFVRKQAKDHGTRRLVEGVPEGALRGKRVVLLEDVTTTAGSVMRAVEAARAEGAMIDLVVTVVDRLEGARENLAAEGLGLRAVLTADDFRVKAG